MNSKVLFVILGLLIVLCVVCTCLGTVRELHLDIPELGIDSDETVETPSWGEGLSSMLERKLDPDDVEAAMPPGCQEQLRQGAFVLAQGDACLLAIKSSYAPMRTLSLYLVEGDLAEVAMDPSEEDKPTMRQTLGDERDETEVQIPKGGGTLQILCLGGLGGDCRLEVR